MWGILLFLRSCSNIRNFDSCVGWLGINGTLANDGGTLGTVYYTNHYNIQGWLGINGTLAKDSGNYTCVPSYTRPDWVYVHILKGRFYTRSL